MAPSVLTWLSRLVGPALVLKTCLHAPMLAHLCQDDALRDALSVALMDMNVDCHLILNQIEQIGPGG